MLNTGMTQIDISDLTIEEYQDGTITRKRSKTRHRASVPTVSYPLWAETRRLLEQYRQTSGEHLLLTEEGKAWIETSLDEKAVYHKRDAIRATYRHLQAPLPLKHFRKTSSSLLDGHPVYGRFAIHFLAQSDGTIAQRHYFNRDESSGFATLFKEAVNWLGEQYGFEVPASEISGSPAILLSFR
jgi:hypothetical protein